MQTKPNTRRLLHCDVGHQMHDPLDYYWALPKFGPPTMGLRTLTNSTFLSTHSGSKTNNTQNSTFRSGSKNIPNWIILPTHSVTKKSQNSLFDISVHPLRNEEHSKLVIWHFGLSTPWRRTLKFRYSTFRSVHSVTNYTQNSLFDISVCPHCDEEKSKLVIRYFGLSTPWRSTLKTRYSTFRSVHSVTKNIQNSTLRFNLSTMEL